MVSIALPSRIPFIPSGTKPFFCSHSALPGEKSGCSLLILRHNRCAPCHWPGRISPCLILLWLWLLAKLCYVLVTCNSSRSFSKRNRLTVRRITDMVQHVTAHHLTRLACLYVRQSTFQQVVENTESTSRQYALRERARALGWADERIVVIDQDLFHSGASTADRLGFQRLVVQVVLRHVGLLLELEVARLARNSSDCPHLLVICALTH